MFRPWTSRLKFQLDDSCLVGFPESCRPFHGDDSRNGWPTSELRLDRPGGMPRQCLNDCQGATVLIWWFFLFHVFFIQHMDMLSSIVYDKNTKASAELSCFTVLEALKIHLARLDELVAISMGNNPSKNETSEIFTMSKLLSRLKWTYGVEKFLMETYARFVKMNVPPSCSKTYAALIEAYRNSAANISQ